MNDIPDLDDLTRRLGDVMHRDRQQLIRRVQQLRTRPADAEASGKLESSVCAAEALVSRRRSLVPAVTYPDTLPITERLSELGTLITDHQVVVIAGATGSGKSTQLPKLCVALGRGVHGLIGHTQPRRLAARTVAERVAEELGTAVAATSGSLVGCTVRFSDTVGHDAQVRVMTDGILLAETRSDRDLLAYDTLIIDEAHERSLNIDFLLGYLHQLLARRPELRVLITSATIDTEKFSKHFGDAPIVEVSGRTFPVEIRYRPFGADNTDAATDDDRDQTQAIVDAIDELAAEGPGDVLVFLSGEREIHDTADALRRLELGNTEITPLYARLGLAEQRRIFQPHGGRRIVLATNVAETSLTVPGIRYVVDAGTARISRFNRRTKVQRLPIEAVSQASANQRSGRCGRLGPGVCIRLYTQDDFVKRDLFTEPEILRTNLASVILQAASLQLGDVACFPFVDPPDTRAINDGIALLEELGALEASDTRDVRLTPLGRRLARLPIDPRLARMVLEAAQHNCAREVLVIAAGLSIQDPRERPNEKAAAADQLHARFRKEGSDFLGYVALWEYIREQQRDRSKGEFRRMCRAEFLNYLRVREWQDVERQLRDTAKDLGITLNREPADAERIHRSLLVGLLSQIGMRPEEDRRDRDRNANDRRAVREFVGARNMRFAIAPGSVLAKRPPPWVMVAELVETNRLWGRIGAGIQTDWIERAAAHLVTRSHSDPRWDARRGTAVITERVALFGLVLVAGRTVDLAKVDPIAAREMFVRSALVEREWDAEHDFLTANDALVARIEELQDRARRHDVLASSEARAAFYAQRIPAYITSAHQFNQWMREQRRRDNNNTPEDRNALLTFTPSQLIDPEAGALTLDDFPDDCLRNGIQLKLAYAFAPGESHDGITATISLFALPNLTGEDLDWMIPGLRAAYVEALARALPKDVRRELMPIADHVEAFLHAAKVVDAPITEAFAQYVNLTATGLRNPVEPGDFAVERLPAHLRLHVAIADTDGKVLATGDDFDRLKASLEHVLRSRVAELLRRSGGIEEVTGLTDWSIGAVPEVIEVAAGGGHTVRGYPALADETAGVALRVLTSRTAQRNAMRGGILRLLTNTVSVARKPLERLLSNDARFALSRQNLGTIDELLDDAILAAVARIALQTGSESHIDTVWDRHTFDALRDRVWGDASDAAASIVRDAGAIVVAAANTRLTLEKLHAPAFDAAATDIELQLRRLVPRGFIASLGAGRVADVVRYVQAAEVRANKLSGDVERDRARSVPIKLLTAEIDDVVALAPRSRRDEVLELRWMVEELRVSVFAPGIRTSGQVSEKRIRRQLDEIAPPVAL